MNPELLLLLIDFSLLYVAGLIYLPQYFYMPIAASMALALILVFAPPLLLATVLSKIPFIGKYFEQVFRMIAVIFAAALMWQIAIPLLEEIEKNVEED